MNRRSIIAAGRCLAIGALLTTAGCGIDAEESPRDIDLVAAGQRPARNVEAANTTVIYLVAAAQGGKPPALQPVVREVSKTAATVLEVLFSGPTPQEAAMGVHTALPTGTRLLSTTLQGDLLTVDVSSTFLTVADDLLVEALGQIVLTGTHVEGVDSVLVTVAGEQQAWKLGEGEITGDPMSPDDFATLIQSSQPTLADGSVVSSP